MNCLPSGNLGLGCNNQRPQLPYTKYYAIVFMEMGPTLWQIPQQYVSLTAP